MKIKNLFSYLNSKGELKDDIITPAFSTVDTSQVTSTFVQSQEQPTANTKKFPKIKLPEFRSLFSTRTIFFWIGGLIILALLIFILRATPQSTNNGSALGITTQPQNLKKPDATETLNREFQFPIRDEKGTEITKLKYVIENAELRDEIIIKGEKATLVSGRTFLILNLKLTNDYTKTIEINAKDYIRLSINGNTQELLAADVHNDPVLVQPTSTKITRLGFAINDSDSDAKILVGEIGGEKQTIDLQIK